MSDFTQLSKNITHNFTQNEKKNDVSRGIVICGSSAGVNIAANKVNAIKYALICRKILA